MRKNNLNYHVRKLKEALEASNKATSSLINSDLSTVGANRLLDMIRR